MNAHPTAVIGEGARLGPGTRVGPYAVVGSRVEVGARCEIGAHVVIDGITRIGDDCRLFPFAAVGLVPQDLKFRGEDTRVEIGHRNVLREFVTVHAGTAGGGGVTRIGHDNLIMAYAHIAHDCWVGNSALMANAATLAGHVRVEDFASVGAFSGIHQFCRIGKYAYIGGYSVLTQDAIPFVLTVGNRARTYGINLVGLRRRKFPAATLAALQDAYRILFRKRIPFRRALEEVQARHAEVPEVGYLLDFIRSSERGIIR
ncbi:MAG: acyl-ACP--UDP-N-acetylglucosamine O-acyltransferase [Acidobacteria bacterium]|nr:acyl-ACP--UDP-N-acetylglucosamine O-acyltransferase [Acidobacteriota bacterium]